MNELKPCPFCGSNDIKVHGPYFIEDRYVMVRCIGCIIIKLAFRGKQ